MGEISKEILVKRKPDLAEQILKYTLIVLTVLLFLVGFLGTPLLLGIGVLVILLCYFLFPRFHVEYEYNYFQGEIDVDRIMSRRKRKRMGTYQLERVVWIALTGDEELERFRSEGSIRVHDYSSRLLKVPSWTFVFKSEMGYELVRMELDQEIMDEIRRLAPGKVHDPGAGKVSA